MKSSLGRGSECSVNPLPMTTCRVSVVHPSLITISTQRNMSSRFSSNTLAIALKLLETLQVVFIRH